MPTFNGSEGDIIPIEQAVQWTSNYCKQAETDEGKLLTQAHFYGREILQKLLDQEGCMGIRMYYGIDEEGQKQLILVGADADGNDLEEMVVDHSSICPPDCATTGRLNG